MIHGLSNSMFLALIQNCLTAFIILCITIVIIVIIVQAARTMRAKILADRTPTAKKDELIGKQLEKEFEDKNVNKDDIIDITKRLIDKTIK